MKITSVNNDLVKETAKLLRSKHRDETGLFLIEGEKGVKEAIEAGIEIERIFILEGVVDFASNNTIETTESVLAKISDAKIIEAVCEDFAFEYDRDDKGLYCASFIWQ